METTNKTYGETWIDNIRLIFEKGIIFHDSKIKILEITNLSNTIMSPDNEDRIIEFYGDKQQLKRMNKKFSELELQPKAHFSYAQRLFDYQSVNQVEWLIQRLKKKIETKSATISTLIPGDNSMHLPCFTTLDVKIRNNKLISSIFFRSQNVGTRQPYNFLAINRILNGISTDLNIKQGDVFYHIASAHIYEKDFKYCRNILNQGAL